MAKIFTALKSRLEGQNAKWLVLLIDLFMTGLSFVLSVAIVWQSNWRIGLKQTSLLMAVGGLTYGIFYLVFKPYRGIIRYVGLQDVTKIMQATFVSLLIFIFAIYVIDISFPKQHVIFVALHFLLTTNFLIFYRILYKKIYARSTEFSEDGKNYLIYGTEAAGKITAVALQAQGSKVVAFIEETSISKERRIEGIEVLPPSRITNDFLLKENVEEILISTQDIQIAELKTLVQKFEGLAVKLKLVPLLNDWIDDRLEATQIQEVHIEELLGRDIQLLEKDSLYEEVENKVVLVTGASGTTGWDMISHLIHYPFKKAILVDSDSSAMRELEQDCVELFGDKEADVEFLVADIEEKDVVDRIYNRFRPDLVYHAAAYNKMSMGDRPYGGIAVNIKGTNQLLALANRYGVEKLVMVEID